MEHLRPFIAIALAGVAFVGALWLMANVDEYRIGQVERNIADLETYVAALEERERGVLQRVTVLETQRLVNCP